MKKLTPISHGPRGLVGILNEIMAFINAIKVAPGDGITVTECGTGWIIAAKTDDATGNGEASTSGGTSTNSGASFDQGSGSGTGGSGTGESDLLSALAGGSGSGGGSGGSPNLSGTGGSTGWSFLGPVDAGNNGGIVYPSQIDLPAGIDTFVLTRVYADNSGADAISIGPSGVSGTFPQRYNFDGSPFTPTGGYYYTIRYHYAIGGDIAGPTSPAFTVPVGGGTIILGGSAIFIPHP